ncbi:hypothetical protein Csa_022754, partial [Cucumis sativus]
MKSEISCWQRLQLRIQLLDLWLRSLSPNSNLNQPCFSFFDACLSPNQRLRKLESQKRT